MKVSYPLLILLLALSVLSSCGWVKGKITFPSNSSSPLVLSATLAFTTNPVASNTDAIFSTQPVITSYDQFGNILTNDSTSTITLSAYDGVNCSGNIVAASLAGTTAVNLSSGIATFTDVRLLKISIRSLKATSGAIATCSSSVSVSAGAASQISISSGDAQTGAVNTAISPFIALVTDDNLNTVSNATINWSVTSGTGSLSSASSLSNSSGLATTTLTLGTVSGARVVSATVNGTLVSVDFNSIGSPGLPASIAISAGNTQTGTAGSPLPVDLTVLVTDSFNNPVPSITINWAIVSGGGSVAATSQTDASGLATVTHTLGNSAGANSVSATVNGQSMLNQVFTSTGLAGVATQIAIVSGNNQSVSITAALGSALVVQATDALNNMVENTTIDWAISNGSMTANSTVTLATGNSSNTATAGSTPGAQTITATINGLAANVVFNFTQVFNAPTSLSGNNGDASSSLSWTASTGAQSYNIYTSATSGGGYSLLGRSATAFYSASLTNGQTYYIVVTAVNGVNETSYSNEIVVTPAPAAFSAWIKQLGDVTMASFYSSILNSGFDDMCTSSVTDGGGNVYCAGSTYSSLGSIISKAGTQSDAFVMKLNSDGVIQWVSQIGNGDNEVCNGVTLDSVGNVYCAGSTDGAFGEESGGGLDAFIVKLNATYGDVVWITQLGAVTQVAPGYNAGDDACTSVVFIDDVPALGFLDNSDLKIACAGHTNGAVGEANGGGEDAFVMKVDYDGNLEWVTQLGTTTFKSGGSSANNSGDDYCYGITTTPDFIYCAGKTTGSLGEVSGGGEDAFMMGLGTNGSLSWLTQIGQVTKPGGEAASNDACKSITSNGTSVYCGGYTEGSLGMDSGGGSDAMVIDLNRGDGTLNWIRQLGNKATLSIGGDSSGEEICHAVAIARSGNIICAGSTSGSFAEANAGRTDAFVMSLRNSGVLNWVRQFGQSTHAANGKNTWDDTFLGVSVSVSSSRIYCVGSTTGAFADTNGGGSDAFITILDDDGVGGMHLIAKQLGTNYQRPVFANLRGAFCRSVATDGGGNVYCAGETNNNLGEARYRSAGDSFIMKTDPDGNILWVTQLGVNTGISPGSNASYDECLGIAVDSSENVYCAGATSGNLGDTNSGLKDAFVLKLDSEGKLQWVTQLGATANMNGDVYQSDSNDSCNAVAVDSSDNVYCAGSTTSKMSNVGAGGGAFVMKLDTDGTIQWISQQGTGNASFGEESCNSVAVDSSNNVYCAGRTSGDFGEQRAGVADAFVFKLDPNGDLVWVRQLGNVTKVAAGYNTGDDRCTGVAVDSLSNVYCSGYTDGNVGEANGGGDDAFVLKLDPNGLLLWVKQLGDVTKVAVGHNTSDDYCSGLAVDLSDNVYCAGSTSGNIGETNAGGFDAFILKFNTNGSLGWVTQFGALTKDAAGDNSNTNACLGVAVDKFSNVYCAGWTRSSMAGFNSAGTKGDPIIIKINSSGQLH